MYEQNLQRYDQIVATNPNFERKGKTMPYTSANGYMFSLLNKDAELGIRLPKDMQLKFIEEHGGGEFKSYGVVMKDYVHVPNELLTDVELLGKYLQAGYEHVMALPPK